MEFYSNNYSKYIETLKAEKSKKAFQELVKNSQEIKSEVVSFIENYSTKETNNLSSKESLPNKENSTLYSTSKPIGAETFLDADEYSAISTRVEIENGDREKNEVSSVETSDESFENKTIDSKISETEKTGNEIAKVTQNESRSGSEISLENEVSKKEGNNVSLENESAEKAGNAVSEQITDSERNGIDLSREDSAVEKSASNLIYKIIEEKKTKKELTDSVTEDKKGFGSFKDFNSEPKKNAPYNLAKSFQYFLKDGRKYEASQYESNAKNYSYYPAGDYATMESSAGQTVSDIIGTITNKSNWSSPGNAIVSALKVATSVVDMINLSGPSRNIYVDGVTANNLRWDLKVAEQDKNGNNILFEDKPKRNFKATYSDEENSVYYNTALKAFKTKKDEDTKLKENGTEKEEFAETESTDKDLTKIRTLDAKTNLTVPFVGELFTADDKGLEDNDTKLKENGTEKEKFAETKDTDKGNVVLKENGTEKEKFAETKSADKDLTKVRTLDAETNLEVPFVGELFATDDKGLEGNDTKLKGNGTEKEEEFIKPADGDRENTVVLKENGEEKDTRFTYNLNPNRDFDEYEYLGKIFVIPPFNELSGTEANGDKKINVAFTIPLQNNLQFEQISRAASYNAISFFGRIGDVQQYSKSGSLEAITLTTKYFVEGDDNFSMAKLQDIEMKYRSLVLPAQSSANYLNSSDTKSTFYYFTRPPVINVVLGKNAHGVNKDGELPTFTQNYASRVGNANVYKNLFTDVYSTYNDGKYEHGIFYKNFVVTNVSIDKNDNDYNYYVENGGDYLDKMGFTVTLTVLEIDENYLGSIPSFNNYYNTIISRSKSSSGEE